jgi:hypothetical protein
MDHLHARDYRHADGFGLDLHWHLLLEAAWPGADDALWRSAVPLRWQGRQVLALAPTEQLFHALVQDTGSGHEPSPHVLLDAAQVLANDEVDGSRLVELARALHQVTTIDAALRALESLGVALPRTARSAIARAPVSFTEAICHELRRGPRGGARAPLRILATYWFRRGRGRGAVRALAELPAYLRMRLVEP